MILNAFMYVVVAAGMIALATGIWLLEAWVFQYFWNLIGWYQFTFWQAFGVVTMLNIVGRILRGK